MKQWKILLNALIAALSTAVTWSTIWFLGGGVQASLLGAVLALTLSRRTFANRGDFFRSAAALPVIGVVASGVGFLLVSAPPLGGILYVAGMSVPIWLRRFGPRAQQLGTLITLPLIGVLIVPFPAHNQHTVPEWVTLATVMGASAIAVLWVAVGREIRALLGALSSSTRTTHHPPGPRQLTNTSRRLPSSTRMALQMAVAVAASFVLGWIIFPDHVMWVVLTAFIVTSGNRGRDDVLHKSVLRVSGALMGTILVSASTLLLSFHHESFSGAASILTIFVMIFVGDWLRAYSYAFWALTVTLILSLLEELIGGSAMSLSAPTFLYERVLAIVLGGALGVCSAWFIAPIRSGDVIRRRLSDMLDALAHTVTSSGAERVDTGERLDDALHSVNEMAPAQRARRVLQSVRPHSKRQPLPIDVLDDVREIGAVLTQRTIWASNLAGDHPWCTPDAQETVLTSIRGARRSLRPPADWENIHSQFRELAATVEECSIT